jgi:putative membrane protein
LKGLEIFSFQELWSPVFLFVMMLLGIGYYYLIGPWRLKHAPDEARPTKFKQALVVSGLLLFYLSQGGPLELMGHLNFTFHMVNMSLSYLIVPPIMLLGIPAFVWRKVFASRRWRSLQWATHPFLALIGFNMLFSIYHVPVVHDYVMTHYAVHIVYYSVMLIASFLMWWQIVTPVPEWKHMADVRKMGYIFANGVLLTPACALIIFSGAPLYSVYTDPTVWATAMGYCVSGDPMQLLTLVDGPTAFSLMNPLEDQQSGGIIMKLVQEVMYGAILAYVFNQWYRREHKDDELPPNAEPSRL